MLTRSSRMLVKLGALGLGMLASGGCTPDVHIHIYNDGGESSSSGSGESMPASMSGMATANGTMSSAGGDPTNGPTTDPTTDPTNDPSDPTADPTNDPTDPTTDTNETGDSTGDGDDTGAGVNMYPQPINSSCEAGFRYNSAGGFEYCAPPCPAMGACPDGLTGDAMSSCQFNPDSSNTACDPKNDTCAGDETCAGNSCELPASHCVLRCETTCPDGMECSPMSACRYPIPA